MHHKRDKALRGYLADHVLMIGLQGDIRMAVEFLAEASSSFALSDSLAASMALASSLTNSWGAAPLRRSATSGFTS
jgi:hypothetical protein